MRDRTVRRVMETERRRAIRLAARKRKRQDRKDAAVALLGIVALLLVLGNIVAYYAAPCDSLGWLPLKSAPLRCVVESGR